MFTFQHFNSCRPLGLVGIRFSGFDFCLIAKNHISGDFLSAVLMWGEQDSNLRRRSQQIYSLPSLAA